VVTAEQLAARREQIAASGDLQRLLAQLAARAQPVLERMPHIPEEKALFSRDGGVCPKDGAALAFDPWSPRAHRCPRCGERYAGERHDRHWARYQHLWLAERAAHLAALATLGDSSAAAARARELLTAYGERYLRYPNRDNVLGPSRLFFSTYLESLWICNYLAAAALLREAEQLDEATTRAVAQVADEAANLIGEFDEGFSNRQTWNNAALAAIAVWFEDEALAERAITAPTGLMAHLARGYGRDGMWYEGENYHLFALRGLLTGAAWARWSGVDVFTAAEPAARVQAALRAPAATALPDFTYPARKDSRFGVSLAQPAHLELWEIGLARLGMQDADSGVQELASWLAALYRAPAPAAELLDYYLHDAPIGEPDPSASGAASPTPRSSLSWWSLLEMLPALPADTVPWLPASELLETQGLAVLRAASRYASLECGPSGGGHGHHDRLNLTLHADGVLWLADPGTGSYASRDLFWYRATLAHNAPRLDGRSQSGGDAACEAFEVKGDWAWVRGRYGDVTRVVVSGPEYVLDVVDLASRDEHVLEVPWHVGGAGEATAPGRWEPGELADEFVARVERLVPHGEAPRVVEAAVDGRRLRAHFGSGGELLRAEGPGKPGSGTREAFYCVRARGRGARLVTVLESVAAGPTVRAVRVTGEVIDVETARGVDRHSGQAGGWSVAGPAGTTRLSGRRQPQAPFQPLLHMDAPTKARGSALRVDAPPALDGTLAGFDVSEPLTLDVEDQYRRSEEPYPGPEDLCALAYVNWTDEALYVAAEVTKADLCFRPPDASPLGLDNEPEDIHSDGLQLYLEEGEQGDVLGFLIVPEGVDGGGVRVHAVGGTAAGPDLVRGAWARTEQGYRVTLAVAFSERVRAHAGGRLGFDLLVNEMLPGRERRAGQLVWSGGNGWVWLWGDRQSPERFGVLELVG